MRSTKRPAAIVPRYSGRSSISSGIRVANSNGLGGDAVGVKEKNWTGGVTSNVSKWLHVSLTDSGDG